MTVPQIDRPDPEYCDEGIFGALDKWPDWAHKYEHDLGAYLHGHPEVRNAAQKTLVRLHEVLAKDYQLQKQRDPSDKRAPTFDEAMDMTACAFFMDEPESAGQLGNRPELISYLKSSKANTREIMTAIFNAAYFRARVHSRSKNKDEFEDISLKKTIHRMYFKEDGITREVTAEKLKLNARHLRHFTDYLKSLKHEDVLNVVDMTSYSGLVHKMQYGLSQWARGPQTSEVAAMRASQLAQIDMPLSKEEYAFHAQGAPDVITLHDFTTEDRAIGNVPTTPEGIVKLREMQDAEPGLIDVQPSYTFHDGTLKVTKYTVVKADLGTATAQELSDGRVEEVVEYPLKWKTGAAYHKVSQGSPWSIRTRMHMGYPLVAGTSGTAARMFSCFAWLSVPECKPEHFLYALMAWMIPPKDHSLHEILHAARITLGVDRSPEERLFCAAQHKPLDELTGIIKNNARVAYKKIEDFISEDLGTHVYDAEPTAPELPLPQAPGNPEETVKAYEEQFDNHSLVEYPPDRDGKGEPIEEWHGLLASLADMIARFAVEGAENACQPEATIVRDWLNELDKPEGLLELGVKRGHILAIRCYTSGAYKMINPVIRRGERMTQNELRKYAWEMTESYLRDLQEKPEEENSHWPAGCIKATFECWQAEHYCKSVRLGLCSKSLAEESIQALKRSLSGIDWPKTHAEMYLHHRVAYWGLHHLPLCGDSFAYRGVRYVRGASSWLSDQMFRNIELTTSALTSCSESRTVTEEFALRYIKWPSMPGMVELHQSHGRKIWGLSYYPGEKEVVVLPGVKFKRTGDVSDWGIPYNVPPEEQHTKAKFVALSEQDAPKTAKVTISLTGPSNATAGDRVDLEAVVSNAGPDDFGVEIVTQFPDKFERIEIADSGFAEDGLNRCRPVVVKAGESEKVSISATIKAGTRAGRVSASCLIRTPDSKDHNTAAQEEQRAQKAIEVMPPSTKLSIVSFDGPGVARAGDPVTYTVKVENDGHDDPQAVVKLVVGAGLHDAAITGFKGTSGVVEGSVSIADHVLTQSVNLPNGSSASFSIVGTVASDATEGTVLKHTAEVNAGPGVTNTARAEERRKAATTTVERAAPPPPLSRTSRPSA
ncbi:hypothetical protein AB8O64_35600 (plasmid) [Streptomyces sp. QH1-20]|uniref:COG1470 family protein n=1 Tax=Streptomyces sp. QH1-20 TaxID=3240934 RepID=UPI00351882B8